MNELGKAWLIEEVLVSMGDGEGFFNKTVPLRDGDYGLIGEFIQAYTWADLNGRRIINQLRRINKDDAQEFASRLTDAQVLEHLRAEANVLGRLDNIKSGILIALDTLEMHRRRRHEFSHWSFRRVKDHDAYVMFTLCDKEARVRGIERQSGGVGFGLMLVRDVRHELDKLNGHVDYLAVVVAALADFEVD